MPESSSSATPLPMLDILAAAAGFRRAESLPVDGPTPLVSELWLSDFAVLAVVRVPEAAADSLDRAFIRSSEWISGLLTVEERKGRLIDGYLLLAIPSKPDRALLEHVRRVESDTSICRKHVLWPEPDHSWLPSLYAVTALGLPSAVIASDQVTEPVLPWVASRALDERENGRSFEEVASLIEDLPEDESEKDQHVN